MWTLQRIPRSNRKEVFIILEILLRSSTILDIALDVDELYLAAGCSLHHTFDRCRREIAHRRKSDLTHEKKAASFKNLCGGLLEVVRHDDKSDRVQFMHKTVKEFISKPETQSLLLTLYDKIEEINGAATLFKYHLSTMEDLIDLSEHGFRRSIGWITKAAACAYAAEAMTGTHQAQFIDSIPQSFFQRINNLPGPPIGCDSPMSIGVIAGLRLYLDHCLSKRSSFSMLPPNQQEVMLKAASRWALASAEVTEHRLAEVDETSVGLREAVCLQSAGAVEYLLERGAWKLSPYLTETFKALFEPPGGFFCFQSWTIEPLTRVLLKAGQMSNVRLKQVLIQYAAKERVLHDLRAFTPLHVALSPLSEALLMYGADVNATDANGRTPLDIIWTLAGDQLYASVALQRTLKALVDCGGRVSKPTTIRFQDIDGSIIDIQPDVLEAHIEPKQLQSRHTSSTEPARQVSEIQEWKRTNTESEYHKKGLRGFFSRTKKGEE